MGRVIVVTSGKGGVGKTTVSANLGTALAMLAHRTVIVDADIGLRNLDLVMGLENRVVFNSLHVMEGECKLESALVKDKRVENLYLLAAPQSRNKDDVDPENMEKMVKQLSEKFDFVIIDCPAGIEQGFQNAVIGAKEALVIVTPEVSSVRDADRVIGLLQATGIESLSYVLNRLSQQLVDRGDMLSQPDVQEILRVPILGVIPEDHHITASTNVGKPLAIEGGTPAGDAFGRIARRVLGEKVPVPEFRYEGKMARFWKWISGNN
ncbi:MAG: septum site-determining protein MinD [Candidatus Poribacteria bacterium]|nr:septum site-determining protein MinD [Candidatus Poribacteria bacterium]